jgi:hydroxymethylbilane synthase
MREICIAGRGSRLAMVQNERIADLLKKEGYAVRIMTVKTLGDRDRKSSVTALGGNGPFVRDVEKALLSGEADIAVHCVKDLPYEMAPGLCIAGMPDAADPRDCLLLRKGAENAKADGAALVIGTGSPRRIRQLLKLAAREGKSIECKDIRGNITTRLDKLRQGDYDGIVLAKAGLDRIQADLGEFTVRVLEPEEMIPAVGQGMLACECRESDEEMRALLAKITPAEHELRYRIEREIFCRYRCDCRSAVGIHARIVNGVPELLVMYEE